MSALTYSAEQVAALLAQLDQLRQERLSLLAQLANEQAHPTSWRNEGLELSELGRFSAGLLHDLRGSLAIAQHHMAHMQAEVSSEAAEIVTRQLQFCQLTLRNWEMVSNTVQPQPQWVDVKTAVLPIFGLLTRKLNGIQTKVAIAPELPLLWIDPVQLQQLLFVLCKNSAEAMPHGGQLRLLGWQEGNRILLQISDDGVGIATNRLPKLFGVEESSKPHGIGMGLRVAQTIMQQTNGEISVASQPGEGTAVVLSWRQESEQSS